MVDGKEATDHEAQTSFQRAHMHFWIPGPKKKSLLGSTALKLRNELHDFKTTCAKCLGASATECRSCLYGLLVRVRTNAVLDESIEALRP